MEKKAFCLCLLPGLPSKQTAVLPALSHWQTHRSGPFVAPTSLKMEAKLPSLGLQGPSLKPSPTNWLPPASIQLQELPLSFRNVTSAHTSGGFTVPSLLSALPETWSAECRTW